ncbi:MAG: hypothetical protein R8K47_04225, partial [Mariprofundaceae bacterium]
ASLLRMFARHARPGALALMPTGRERPPVEGDRAWRYLGEARVRAGDEQVIRRYRFTAGIESGGI